MIAVSTSEFRKNLRKYLNLSKVERVIIQCGKNETFELLPKERMSETDKYFSNPKVIADIEESKKAIKEGRVTRIKDPYNIWESIL